MAEKKKIRLKPRGIKGRWILAGISFILLALLLCIFVITAVVANYYYSSMRTGLEAKAKTATEFFTSYVTRTYAEYNQSVSQYAQSFEDKDVLELQFVNTRGKVITSSYSGMSSGVTVTSPDVAEAISTGKIVSWTGRRASTGERVLSVSAPLMYYGQVVGVMRYITSLRLVDRQMIQVAAIVCSVGLAVVLAVLISNTYFIRTITDPILELTGIARRIAEGSYGIQAKKTHDDEIGELTDAINEMSAKISQAEKMQGEFISSVSHELRTPLTAITGWSETLAYDEAIQGDSRRGIAIISKEAARLTKMVEELLEFTRIQDGRFNLNVEKIDIAAELEDSIFTYRELLRQDNMELEYAPPEQELPMILGDPERLKQVFLNILDNASKYGHDGGRIQVSIGLDGGDILIKTRDFGPGIPENELPYVKQKFYKGSSKERGSGIGLAVCEEIVTRHNGRLDIENAPGGGTLVTVRLPGIKDQEA